MNKPSTSQMVDWEDLVSSFPITLHFDEDRSVTIEVRPLSIEGWAQVFSWVQRSQESLRQAGIQLDSLQETSTLVNLLQLILSTAPSLLSMASGLPEQVVRSLPASAALDLLEGLLDINQRSLGRFQERMQVLVGKLMKTVPASAALPTVN